MTTDYSVTPAPIDAFSRFQALTFDETLIVGVPNMFQRLFGRPGSQTLFTQDAGTVEIDIVRNEGERLARMVERGTNARILSGVGHKDLGTTTWASNSRKWPLVEEEGSLSADQLLFRDPGEQSFAGKTRQARMRTRARRINVESVRRCVRLFEYLSMQSVITGTMPAILGTTDDNMIYDFLRNPDHTFQSADSWGNASYNLLADWDTAWQLIRINAHMNNDFVLLGETAINRVMSNTIVKDRADNRRFGVVEIGAGDAVPPKFQHIVDGGGVYRGWLFTPAGHKIAMFTYDEYYTDDAGDPQPYLAKNLAVFGCSNARSDRYFGPPERNPVTSIEKQLYRELFGFNPDALPMGINVKGPGAVLDPAWFYFDFYEPHAKKSITLRCQTAPIFATTQTDAWVVIDTDGAG